MVQSPAVLNSSAVGAAVAGEIQYSLGGRSHVLRNPL